MFKVLHRTLRRTSWCRLVPGILIGISLIIVLGHGGWLEKHTSEAIPNKADPVTKKEAGEMGKAVPMTAGGRTEQDTSEAIRNFRQNRYEAFQRQIPRDGPGEMGRAVPVTAEEAKLNQMGLCAASSDKVPLNRSLPDVRRAELVSYTISIHVKHNKIAVV